MKVLVLALMALVSGSAEAALCTSWGSPKKIGSLDRRALDEASGMVVSKAFPDTLYLHNDSGSRASFYKTTWSGSGTQEIEVAGGTASDVEDMAYGPCPGKAGARCLFLADIGDNFGWRGSLTVNVVEELATMPRQVRALSSITLSYPNGNHNAEAFAVHPNGDFYIVTKDNANPPQVFRFPAAEVAKGRVRGQSLGSLDMKKILGDSSKQTYVTGMDMSEDGTKFLLITYLDAVEFAIDLSTVSKIKTDLVKGVDYSVAKLQKLSQQESIAYLPGSKSFIYTSESADGEEPPILQVDCQL